MANHPSKRHGSMPDLDGNIKKNKTKNTWDVDEQQYPNLAQARMAVVSKLGLQSQYPSAASFTSSKPKATHRVAKFKKPKMKKAATSMPASIPTTHSASPANTTDPYNGMNRTFIRFAGMEVSFPESASERQMVATLTALKAVAAKK